MLMDVYLTKKYRKIYDAEDAERLKKALAEEAIEEEKERLRAERRAANPDGITENTSKKKMQKKHSCRLLINWLQLSSRLQKKRQVLISTKQVNPNLIYFICTV